MKRVSTALGGLILAANTQADLRIERITPDGWLAVTNTFTNGICTLLRATNVAGPWSPAKNLFTTTSGTNLHVDLSEGPGFFRARCVSLDGGRQGFTNLIEAYGVLTTVAGAGARMDDVNEWNPSFEGQPAVQAELSAPHIAMADHAGTLFIADKEAHAIRKVTPDGRILTVAGTNVAGNGPDRETPGTAVALSNPNGLWVAPSGTVFILDLDNRKVRRLGTNGVVTTLFTDSEAWLGGRGLWVSDDETLVYWASMTVVKKWTQAEGATIHATGFIQLGNLVVDPGGRLVVTDRGDHRVWRLEFDGTRTAIAGNGAESGGGDGQPATQTALREVRAVWFLPNGAFFVGTHYGSQVWYVDTAGTIHLFLNGSRNKTHAGDGTWFYAPEERRISEVRALTLDPDANLLITEHDAGYVRKVRFLP